MSSQVIINEITIPEGASVMPGLKYRHFQGEEDFPKMHAVITGSRLADGIEYVESLEDLQRNYRYLVNSDPYQDMLIVEMNRQLIGYTRVWWYQVANGPRVYGQLASLLPEWRDTDIRRTMLRYNEQRCAEIARAQAYEGECMFEAWANETETHWCDLLRSEGYTGVRFGYLMVRPDLNEIPDIAMPEGLEVRPVSADQYLQVHYAAQEAFRDHWGYSDDEWDPKNLEAWKQSETFRPELWQVAWEGNEVAGMVLNYIDKAENEANHRLRGYTETICVRRPWRRRGLARALIARSLQVHKEQGMTETALGVDTNNPNGALQLYQSMGYRTVKTFTTYRKRFDVGALSAEEDSG